MAFLSFFLSFDYTMFTSFFHFVVLILGTIIESRIERHLVNGVKKLGVLCLKFVSPGTPGVPDRLIITATGKIIFAELKTETGRLAKIQRYTIGEMQKRGADVRVVKGLDNVKALLAEIERMTT